jgi:hypothetical protein
MSRSRVHLSWREHEGRGYWGESLDGMLGPNPFRVVAFNGEGADDLERQPP